jgi:hypothetical protein
MKVTPPGIADSARNRRFRPVFQATGTLSACPTRFRKETAQYKNIDRCGLNITESFLFLGAQASALFAG